ncbi:MAG: helicase-associated domain-containing protein, partial [Planctomycetota bacterium]|nr:helicase-associated domain-containing protein [Planctomycetota bacterium]
FLAFHSTVANPLLAAAEAGHPATDQVGEPLAPAQLESAWRRALVVVFDGFLAPFGGVTFGRESQGFSFELMPLGHHVLGADDELHADALGPETSGAVLVQPDFTIVLTAPAPEVEARLTPIAERTETEATHGVGSLFRLTRASVQAGAHAGLDPERLLDELLEHGPSPLPGNVRHEVAAWSAEVQTLAWERPLVLRCPDAATTERLLMAAGKHLELLGETVLVLGDPKQLAAVTKAAAELGIHLEAPPEAVPKAKLRRGRWRRRRRS